MSDILDQPIGVDPVSPPDVPTISPLRALLDNTELFVGTFDCEVCFFLNFCFKKYFFFVIYNVLVKVWYEYLSCRS